ncbi:hypothetical protein H311_04421 [Anncaliia algerae PRA109]|nr:hypothetical protein H311_04421 [Anncaliia algerae PRA109]
MIYPGSIICTDEHKSYSSLTLEGFVHHTVCHKHNFVVKLTQVHTQAIECFNNELKYEIKRRKGVKSNLKKNFLIEFI